MEITKKMLLGEFLRNNPEAAEVFMEMGMHCIGCPSSQMETLLNACTAHGLDSEAVLAGLNGREG